MDTRHLKANLVLGVLRRERIKTSWKHHENIGGLLPNNWRICWYINGVQWSSWQLISIDEWWFKGVTAKSLLGLLTEDQEHSRLNVSRELALFFPRKSSLMTKAVAIEFSGVEKVKKIWRRRWEATLHKSSNHVSNNVNCVWTDVLLQMENWRR